MRLAGPPELAPFFRARHNTRNLKASGLRLGRDSSVRAAPGVRLQPLLELLCGTPERSREVPLYPPGCRITTCLLLEVAERALHSVYKRAQDSVV